MLEVSTAFVTSRILIYGFHYSLTSRFTQSLRSGVEKNQSIKMKHFY